MIFHKGDILQFVLENNQKNGCDFSFCIAGRDIDDSNQTVHLLVGEKLLASRDAHRFNLISGRTPTTMLIYDADDYITYYGNRPYSPHVDPF